MDIYIPRVAAGPQEQLALKSAFVDSGAIQAMVRDYAARPNEFLTGQYSGLRQLVQQIDRELRAKNSGEISLVQEQNIFGDVDSRVWQVLISVVGLMIASSTIFVPISDFGFDDFKKIISVIAVVAAAIGALALINRTK